jgi:two-component sensor histidine kinase
LVALSAQDAPTPAALAKSVQDRLVALARAHELTMADPSVDAPLKGHATTLHALVKTIFRPFEIGTRADASRISVSGPDIPVAGAAITPFALLLHEFATNAAKYGALSVPTGGIDVVCSEVEDRFVFLWRERGGPAVPEERDFEGFGGLLVRVAVQHQLAGEISRTWNPEGLCIRLAFPKSRLAG